MYVYTDYCIVPQFSPISVQLQTVLYITSDEGKRYK